MLETVSQIINKKPMLPPNPLNMSSGKKQNFTETFRVGVPQEPISRAYLDELRKIFLEVEFVKQAAYVLFEEGKQLSYMVLLDLDVKPGQEEQALALIASSVIQYKERPYNGRIPVAFAKWDGALIAPVLRQDSSLHFFRRA